MMARQERDPLLRGPSCTVESEMQRRAQPRFDIFQSVSGQAIGSTTKLESLMEANILCKILSVS